MASNCTSPPAHSWSDTTDELKMIVRRAEPNLQAIGDALKKYERRNHNFAGILSSDIVEDKLGEPSRGTSSTTYEFITRLDSASTADESYAHIWSRMRHSAIQECLHATFLAAPVERSLYVLQNVSKRTLTDYLESEGPAGLSPAQARTGDEFVDGVIRSAVSGCQYLHACNMVVGARAVLPQLLTFGEHDGRWKLPNGLRFMHECDAARTIDLADDNDDFGVTYMLVHAYHYTAEQYDVLQRFTSRRKRALLKVLLKLVNFLLFESETDMTADVPTNQEASDFARRVLEVYSPAQKALAAPGLARYYLAVIDDGTFESNTFSLENCITGLA